MLNKRVKLQFRNGNIQVALPAEIAKAWRVEFGDYVNVYLDDSPGVQQRVILLRETPNVEKG